MPAFLLAVLGRGHRFGAAGLLAATRPLPDNQDQCRYAKQRSHKEEVAVTQTLNHDAGVAAQQPGQQQHQ